METRKFKYKRNKTLDGLIFISENHPQFPNCKVGTIIPAGDMGSILKNQITNLYNSEIQDADIQLNLLELLGLDPAHYEIENASAL